MTKFSSLASKPSDQHSWISLQIRLSQEGPLCRSAIKGLCVELKHEVKKRCLTLAQLTKQEEESNAQIEAHFPLLFRSQPAGSQVSLFNEG